MLPNISIIGGVAITSLLLGSGGAWWATATYKDSVWKASILEQQVAAAKILQTATEQAASVERANVIIAQRFQEEHYANEKKRASLQRTNRELAAQLGGLRDPGHREDGRHDSVPAPTTDSIGASRPSTSGVLSGAAQEFLFNLTADGDATYDYAALCYRFTNGLPLDER